MVSTSSGGARPHDIRLLDSLSDHQSEAFHGYVYRATRLTADPTAFSTNGGRWAPPGTYAQVPVLYTCLERDGAIAEVASYLAMLAPRPSKPIIIHRLRVTAEKVVRLNMDDLSGLGLDITSYKERTYARFDEEPPSRSQEIGAALNFLGFDGLTVPSARWACDNLVLFEHNHPLHCALEPIDHEEVDWLAWLETSGLQLE